MYKVVEEYQDRWFWDDYPRLLTDDEVKELAIEWELTDSDLAEQLVKLPNVLPLVNEKTDFIFDGRDKTQRTGHEKIAMRNIKGAINWIVAGYWKDIQDGIYEYLPENMDELVDVIYECASENMYDVGYEGQKKAPREMRLAGEKFCRNYILWKLENDEDAKSIFAFS